MSQENQDQKGNEGLPAPSSPSGSPLQSAEDGRISASIPKPPPHEGRLSEREMRKTIAEIRAPYEAMIRDHYNTIDIDHEEVTPKQLPPPLAQLP